VFLLVIRLRAAGLIAVIFFVAESEAFLQQLSGPARRGWKI